MSVDLHAVLERITPSPEEKRRMKEFVTKLEADGTAALEALGLDGRAVVQGSLAKGTWLHGNTDADLFLLLDPQVPADRLEGVASDVGARLLRDVQRKYAQHPYVIGTRDGIEVDVVPAYAVPEASARMSAVDRTPFHTAWVLSHLDDAARGQVRLLKQWLKGTGDYGAETAIGGLSGYLCEVLVGALGGFEDVVRHLLAPHRIAVSDDQVEDDVSPWVVVDPVDPARNCAAAVTQETLDHAALAAQAYLASPSLVFFFPPPPRSEPAAALTASLEAQDASWVAARLEGRDIEQVVPQFQKAARAWAKAVDESLPLLRHRLDRHGDEVLVQFLGPATPLPPTRRHVGPPQDAHPNADRFRAKWERHADAAGPVHEVDGHLVVDVIERHRTLEGRLRLAVERTQVGKHVKRALARHEVLTDPALAGPWGPEVADFILGREPWER